MHIVSLLPSATEIVGLLGLGEQLVGVTHECDFPHFVRSLPKVTRTLIPASATSAEIDRLVREQLRKKQALYELDTETLAQLEPDLIVTQALCDVCAVAEEEVRAAACALPSRPRVLNLKPQTLAEVFASIQQVAAAAGVESLGDEIVQVLAERVATVTHRAAGRPRPRVAFLEWLDPPFSSGHWTPELIEIAGGVDCLGTAGARSRTVHVDEILAARPEIVFIACCGYSTARALEDLPRLAATPGWTDLPAVRSGRVYVADGSQYFNRPGPRLVDSLELLAHALDPTAHPLPPHVEPAIRFA